jgi:Ni,Fe-hydrogenase III small subunit
VVTIFSIFRRHGRQYVPDLRKAELTPLFRGRPVISSGITPEEGSKLTHLCPTGAISALPLQIDLGKCIFCKECHFALPEKIRFTNDYKISATKRDDLIVKEGEDKPITVDKSVIRKEIPKLFRKALKLRQVSAGGDNSAEMELNAAGNVNFDMGRYGIEFVASPRHADGIVITGPVTANMAEALQRTFDAVPAPKIIILAGADAISGGIFSGSLELNRNFILKNHIDLYIPGNPPHPLTFINGVLDLINR